MKKIYGLLGFMGFGLLVGAVGGADSAPLGLSVLLMCAGLVMMVMSELLIVIHNRRARLKIIKAKQLLAKRNVSLQHQKKLVAALPVSTVSRKSILRAEPELC